MATWGLHIRIAESLLNRGYPLDKEKFLVGNIGPDCGIPNEDWSRFDPPTEVSHWIESGEIYPQKFCNMFLSNQIEDIEQKSFYIGYYVHLLTDKLWREKIALKKDNDKNYEKLNSDEQFIWTIKKDWYDLDHLYFRNNPESIFYTIFKHIEDFPDYIDYYPEGAVIRQVKYITNFYLKTVENLDREYLYLDEEEMNLFVTDTVSFLENIIKEQVLI
ncbi:MAG: zinc dependent phospholipase C family protein [Spirochaetaceae bacterium]